MTIRITRSARERIGVRDSELQSNCPETGFLSEWYFNTLIIERKHYFLLTESKSLYSILIYAFGLNTQEKFEISLAKNIAKAIGQMNFGFSEVNFEIKEVMYAKTINKAILGSQNDLIYMAKTIPFKSIDETMARINETPMSYLKYGLPIEVFRKEFKGISEE